MRALAAALAALALLAAGCGGDGGETADTGTTTAGAAPAYADEPAAGEALDAFVQAAAKEDYETMWELLSREAQGALGGSEEAFAAGDGRRLAIVLGSLARASGTYAPVLAKRMSEQWAVAAVQGSVTANGETEHGAYAVPLRLQDDAWKIELAGTVNFNPVAPEPELKADEMPAVATEVSGAEPVLLSAVFADDTSLVSELSADELLLTGEVTTPLTPGRHVIVTYGETQSSAGANAYSFVVG